MAKQLSRTMNEDTNFSVTGYLIVIDPNFERSENQYILPKDTLFYFGIVDNDSKITFKPDNSIIVLLECLFERSQEDCINLSNESLTSTVEMLLAEKGLNHITVYVQVIQATTVPPVTTKKDIELRIGIPHNVDGSIVNDIKTVLSTELSPNYNIQSPKLIGTLVSGLVTFKYSNAERIKLIPEDTKFTLYNYKSTSDILALKTINESYRIKYEKNDCTNKWDDYKSLTAIVMNEDEKTELVVELTYFFAPDGHYHKLSSEKITKYLREQLQSFGYNLFSVVTNYALQPESSSVFFPPKKLHPLQPEVVFHKSLISVYVWVSPEKIDEDTVIPDVYKPLKDHFATVDAKYEVLPQIPPPTKKLRKN